MREDWIELELGKVANYLNGRAFKPTEWENEGLPIIRIQNLNNPKANFNYTRKIFEDRFVVNKGDLLFAWSASLGAYIWRGGKAWLNQHIFRVDQKSFISKPFLYYLLDWQTKQLYAKAHGSGMVHVTKKKFEETRIPLPPLPEQRAIVAKIEQLFSELDNGIDNLKKAQEQLKVYRQAVLKKAFEGELTKAWRSKQNGLPTAEELLEHIKGERENTAKIQGKKLKEVPALTQEELAGLPMLPGGWTFIRLGDLAELVGGVTKGRKLEGKEVISLPYLRVANVQDGYLDLKEIKYIDVLPEDLEKYRLIKGDILYTEGGDKDKLGRGTVWKDEVENCIHQNHVFRARAYPKSFSSEFIAYFSQTKGARKYFYDNAKQTTNLASINMTVLSKLPFPLLSDKEQHQIVQEIESRLSVCDKVEETIKESLEKAEALRQSILKKAFEGKLLSEAELAACRNEPDWEPAEKLLERIKVEKGKAGKAKKKEVLA